MPHRWPADERGHHHHAWTGASDQTVVAPTTRPLAGRPGAGAAARDRHRARAARLARQQRSDDPRSSTATGAGALAQLLRDQGVGLSTVDGVDEAARFTDATSSLVVANPDRLSAAEAARLVAAAPGRLVLLRPRQAALAAFGVPATVVDTTGGVSAPGCGDPDAQRAGSIAVSDAAPSYRPSVTPDSACYPTGPGFAQLRLPLGAVRVDLLGGGLGNSQLAHEGNASFATSALGSQPRVVWLMATRAAVPGTRKPTLLPGWWEMAVVQAFLAVVVLGVWRGRRLGPILVEALPVTVRASETVVGHGRLYYRLGARARAAQALRAAAQRRLARRFGHAHDPDQLSAVLAGRTGRDVRSVYDVLYGAPPEDDGQLRDLAVELDQLEQEASRL